MLIKKMSVHVMHFYMYVFKFDVAGLTEYEVFPPCYILIVVLSCVNIVQRGRLKKMEHILNLLQNPGHETSWDLVSKISQTKYQITEY